MDSVDTRMNKYLGIVRVRIGISNELFFYWERASERDCRALDGWLGGGIYMNLPRMYFLHGSSEDTIVIVMFMPARSPLSAPFIPSSPLLPNILTVSLLPF